MVKCCFVSDVEQSLFPYDIHCKINHERCTIGTWNWYRQNRVWTFFHNLRHTLLV